MEAGRSEHRSVYYWKTTFELGKKEQAFLAKHDIDRIYLRMFDVDVKNNYAADTTMVNPVATAQFKSPKPDSIEVVPTVFIIVNALRHYEDRDFLLIRPVGTVRAHFRPGVPLKQSCRAQEGPRMRPGRRNFLESPTRRPRPRGSGRHLFLSLFRVQLPQQTSSRLIRRLV